MFAWLAIYSTSLKPTVLFVRRYEAAGIPMNTHQCKDLHLKSYLESRVLHKSQVAIKNDGFRGKKILMYM